MFLQDRNDLLFRIPLSLHVGISSCLTYREIPHRIRIELKGYGQYSCAEYFGIENSTTKEIYTTLAKPENSEDDFTLFVP